MTRLWRVIQQSVCLAIGVAGAMSRQALAQDAGPPVLPGVRAPSAWETSLSREATNDFSGAREVLVATYGVKPAIYSISVRLAWLSLRMGRGAEAVEMYRWARGLAGALPEATQGLALALTMEGYRELNRGDVPSARQSWRAALDVDPNTPDAREGLRLVGPSPGAAPEVWFGGFTSTRNASAAQAMYATLPYRVSDSVSLRAAYRHVGSATARTGSTGLFGSQEEFYGGFALEHGIAATQVVGFALSNVLATTSGLALGSRIGGKMGATIMGAAIHQTAGWNTQVEPQLFAWLTPFVAVNAGVRATLDPSEHALSVVGGTTLVRGRLALDAQGHLGPERMAFDIAGPTVMSFDAGTLAGGTVIGSVSLDHNRSWTVMVQGQFELLERQLGQTTRDQYRGVAAGVRWIPQQ